MLQEGKVLWLWGNCKQLLQVEMQHYYALYEQIIDGNQIDILLDTSDII